GGQFLVGAEGLGAAEIGGEGGHDFELIELVQPPEPAPVEPAAAPAPEDDTSQADFATQIETGQRWPVADLSREKLLLSETHHRIKNHLQIISSLLNLESNTVTDGAARNALVSSQNRVRSIAELHQHLYQVALGNTESFVEFAEGLVQRLRDCYEVSADRVAVQLDLQTGSIQQEWLMPLALTLNETLSNCFEHAFPDGRAGAVRARLSFTTDGGELVISDDGIGLPEGFQSGETNGLGLKILAVFAEQMRGQFRIGRSESGGTEIQLRFPIAFIDN
ncbi:MAG: sensor histidine kinase, partial [Prosthecobacter sp.]|nr:sensor histidine kinase [Prosthecobacter sp.]